MFAGRGDDRLATRCREMLRRAGVPVPRHGRGDTAVPARLRGYGVTSREMDVLQLVAEGLTNGAIAERLVLSPARSRRTSPTWSQRRRSPDAAA